MNWHRAGVLALATAAASPAAAQGFSPWNDEPFWDRPTRQYQPRREQLDWGIPRQQLPPQQQGGEVRDGGPRPDIAPKAPPVVAFVADYPAGSIVIDSGGRKLYFVLPNRQAFQYSISVGREGFAWAGTEKISRKAAWPDWHPPAEMRQRDPKLPVKMLGGLRNPLGAMALYLGSTLYRIHGTNDEKTIGHASSSGCFRMLNSGVLHLAQFAQVGTPVTVVNSLPQPPAPPPVASRRPPPPEIVARRAPPPAIEPVAPAEDEERFERDAEQDQAAVEPQRRPLPPERRWEREERYPDTARRGQVPVEEIDDYDPYAQRPYPRARAYARRYSPQYDAAPRDGYRDDRYGDRRWYDDERDDY